jgi:hypothetical protein
MTHPTWTYTSNIILIAKIIWLVLLLTFCSCIYYTLLVNNRHQKSRKNSLRSHTRVFDRERSIEDLVHISINRVLSSRIDEPLPFYKRYANSVSANTFVINSKVNQIEIQLLELIHNSTDRQPTIANAIFFSTIQA